MIAKLIKRRSEKGFTQKSFAEHLGMKPSALARIDKMKVIPSAKVFVQMLGELDFIIVDQAEKGLTNPIVTNLRQHDLVAEDAAEYETKQKKLGERKDADDS